MKKNKRVMPEVLNLELEYLLPARIRQDKALLRRLGEMVGELAAHEYGLQDGLLPVRFAQFDCEGETYTAVFRFEEGKAYLWFGAYAERLRVTAPYN